MDDSDRLDTSRWLTSVSTEMARRSFDGLSDPADDESGLRRVDAAGDAMLRWLLLQACRRDAVLVLIVSSRISQNRMCLSVNESRPGLHDEPEEVKSQRRRDVEVKRDFRLSGSLPGAGSR